MSDQDLKEMIKQNPFGFVLIIFVPVILVLVTILLTLLSSGYFK